MLTMVEIINDRGENLALPIKPHETSFVVDSIEGLGPVKATITSSKFANLPGEQYQSSRRGMRNIVLKLGYQPDYITASVSELRNHLYGYLMPETEVSLVFYVDDVKFASIRGRVETFDTDIFSKDPEVVASILCFDPDFLAINETIVSGDATESLVEYPTEYKSYTPTGGVFRMEVTRALSSFTLRNRDASGAHQILTYNHSLVAGDVIEVDTQPGRKRITLTREGVEMSALFGLSPDSTWVTLRPGINNLRVDVVGGNLPFTFKYRTRYGGL